MPAAHKVRWSQLRVGVMAAAALVIIGVLVFLLTGTKKLWTDDVVIYTYMDDAAALATGSPVRGATPKCAAYASRYATMSARDG